MDTQNEWSANQWEAYLTELEVDQTEVLLNQAGIVEAMPEDYYQEGFSELIGTNYSEKLSNMIALLMQALTERQQAVLKLLFWESKTIGEVSIQLGISRAGVKDLRDRALAKISKIMIQHKTRTAKSQLEAA